MAQIDPNTAAREIEEGILKDVISSNARGAVIGLSGGIDSTAVAYLAKRAFDRYNSENNNLKLYGMILPAEANNSADEADAKRIAELLGIEYHVVPIQPAIDTFADMIPEYLSKDFDRANLASEIRADIISRASAFRQGIMLNTGNKDEDHGIGYCTKRGDNLGDLAPIAELPKRLVREVADYIGVPKDIVKREPTAGLSSGETDEKDLGYATAHNGIEKFKNLGTYDYIEIVTNALDQGFFTKQIHEMTGFNIDVIKDIRHKHLYVAPHKNNVAPPSIPVTLEYEPLDWRLYEK